MRPSASQRLSRWSLALIACLLWWGEAGFIAAPAVASGRGLHNWLCYYGTRFGPEVYTRFDLVVLDGHHHPPLERLTSGRPVLLGYLSIGEVAVGGPGWDAAEGQPYLADENRFWASRKVDVRDPRWQALLFERLIPEVLLKGFDGLLLDTFDSALALAADSQGQTGYAGIDQALVEIVKRLRRTYPSIKICVNRGLPILGAIAADIDYVLVEDLYSYYAAEQKAYVKVEEDTRNRLLAQVDAGRRANPGLTVLTLDYADIHQSDLARDAIAFSRSQGFLPYVSTFALDQVFFHTLKRP